MAWPRVLAAVGPLGQELPGLAAGDGAQVDRGPVARPHRGPGLIHGAGPGRARHRAWPSVNLLQQHLR